MIDNTHPLLSGTQSLVPNNAVAALIVDERGHYLMQLRDKKPGIWYPDHWGLFGGGVDDGETPEQALVRELKEELGFCPQRYQYFDRIDLHFEWLKSGPVWRLFFEVPISTSDLAGLRLGEGRRMEAIPPAQLLLERRCVPYDSLAVWMHVTAKQHFSAGMP